MISFVKKNMLAFLALIYLFLFILGNFIDDGAHEGEAVVLFIIVTLVVFVPWLFGKFRSIIKLRNVKKKTELMHLKSQVNPHFFFNTLNNLYGLINKDPQMAGNLVLKLSDMMRYSIYEGEKETVNITEEVEYLNNYIELNKMRYQKKTDVQFNVHIQDETCQITPLLFIILLENAFKHGVEKLREGAYVHINLIASTRDINFAVENNFDPEADMEQKGIGLNNLNRRLALSYPKKHTLTFTKTSDIHKAHLSITF